MFDAETLMKLNVGDIIEAPPLLPGISSENVVIKVSDTLVNGFLFDAYYFNVWVCDFTAKIDTKGALVWTLV